MHKGESHKPVKKHSRVVVCFCFFLPQNQIKGQVFLCKLCMHLGIYGLNVKYVYKLPGDTSIN